MHRERPEQVEEREIDEIDEEPVEMLDELVETIDGTIDQNIIAPYPISATTQTDLSFDKFQIAAQLEMKQIMSNQNEVASTSSGHNNPMSFGVIYSDRKKCKYFTGLFPEQFDALFDFLGPAKYHLTYWNADAKRSTSLP